MVTIKFIRIGNLGDSSIGYRTEFQSSDGKAITVGEVIETMKTTGNKKIVVEIKHKGSNICVYARDPEGERKARSFKSYSGLSIKDCGSAYGGWGQMVLQVVVPEEEKLLPQSREDFNSVCFNR